MRCQTEKFYQNTIFFQSGNLSKLAMLLVTGGMLLAYFFLTGSRNNLVSAVPVHTETYFVIRMGTHVIGTEKVVQKIDEEAKTYLIYRNLPFQWFPEQVQCCVRLNRYHQVLAYERENHYHGIRDIATLEQMGSVNWQFFATNDVQEVTFLENIVLRQDFLPLDENFIGLFQILVDKFDLSTPEIQQVFIFDGFGERRIFVEFERQRLNLHLSESETVLIELDRQQQIKKIHFPNGQQAERVQSLPEVVSKTHSFSSSAYKSVNVQFQSIDGTLLSGILTLPLNRSAVPAVVLVGGTGPNSAEQGGIFTDIAHYLGQIGVASLRYDKRGILGSGGNFLSHTEDQLVDDAEGALNCLSEFTEIDDMRIGLLGYSEGAIIATELASRSPLVSACFLMASPAVRIYPELTKIQVRERAKSGGWSESLVHQVISGIDENSRRLAADSSNWWSYGNRLGYVGWLRSLIRYNPQKIMATFPISIPLIIFQGEKDVIVPSYQANQLVNYLQDKAHPKYELITFPELGHLFGRRVSIPECLPCHEYVAVNPQFLEVLGDKIKEAMTYRPKAESYWVDF